MRGTTKKGVKIKKASVPDKEKIGREMGRESERERGRGKRGKGGIM